MNDVYIYIDLYIDMCIYIYKIIIRHAKVYSYLASIHVYIYIHMYTSTNFALLTSQSCEAVTVESVRM